MMEDGDNMACPKCSHKPTERGVYADSATEKAWQAHKGNKQKKELTAEAYLERLIAQVAHLIGQDYSKECWRGLMGIEDLEAIVDNPTANMEESTGWVGCNMGKGKAVKATPRNSTNYPGTTAGHVSLATQLKQTKPKLPNVQSALPQTSTSTPNSISGLKHHLVDDIAGGASKKCHAEGGSTLQSNLNPSTSTPSKQSTPAAQATKPKYPPLGKTNQISFGGRVQPPSATIIGNYHAPSAPHSRPTASSPSQPQADAYAVGMHTIKKPMLSSSGGSKPNASATPLSPLTCALPVPTKATFAPSPLHIANNPLPPPSLGENVPGKLALGSTKLAGRPVARPPG
ncbi:hypothetical protein BDV93DRAFT_514936 [Ceratobasidium sp. AG-I]|nr:hypothetical protein BDV93DRAFT_514936 [Ceratobasidium sp. AG-I]